MADEKRRVSLKVVHDTPKTLLDRAELGDGSPSERSPWAWVLLGAFANFAVLVPLAMLTMALLKGIYSRGTDRPLWLVVVAIVCLCISSIGGGYLVGRFGGRARALEGMYSGIAAGLVMWGLSRTPMGFVILAWTAPAAYLGGWLGRRSRKSGD